jgi:hypothetical protein
MTPELFAPGIITTPSNEAYPSFTGDGMEFYYKCDAQGGWLYTLGSVEKWLNPQIIPFSAEYACWRSYGNG